MLTVVIAAMIPRKAMTAVIKIIH